MTPTILQKDAPVLRKKAAEVPLADIGSTKIKKILKDMETALQTQDDGVALAAPQIGHSLRIFIVSKAALSPLRRGALPSSAGGVLTPSASEDLGTSLIKKDITPALAESPLRRGALPSSAGGLSGTPFSKGDKRVAGYLTFINPVITKLSRDKATVDEGCLSVRPLYGKVKRSKKATVRAYDEHGKLFERGASGLLAQIFQHECDHLDGILFIDKATDLKELPTQSVPSKP